jgi:hypothetical protein
MAPYEPPQVLPPLPASPLVLQVIGAVLAVLQFGLAVQIIIRGLRDLNVLPPA